jgi:hypothetical protein
MHIDLRRITKTRSNYTISKKTLGNNTLSVPEKCLDAHPEFYRLVSACSRICFVKQAGHTGRGIVSHEPSSFLIFITSSSVRMAPHFPHFLLSSGIIVSTCTRFCVLHVSRFSIWRVRSLFQPEKFIIGLKTFLPCFHR